MLEFLKSKKSTALEVTVSNRTVVRVLILIIISLLGVTALRQAAHALTLIFVAFFLSLALNAPVHWLAQRLPAKKDKSRSIAVGISFLVIIGLLIAFIASLVPPMIQQTGNLIDAAPGLVDDLRDQDSGVGQFIQHYNLEDQIDTLSDELSNRLGGASGSLVGGFTRITSSVFSVLTVLVLTFMMLIEGPAWISLTRRLVPGHERERVDYLIGQMYKVIKGYVNGQFILAVTAALFIFVALLVLDIDYPVALLVVVFICGLIPMVGHLIGAVIVTVVALFTSPLAAAIILAYYFLYQQIENYVIQPKVQSSTTNMSPLLVFSSVIIGVSFSGLLGGLVAIPVAGCLRILVLEYLERRGIRPAPIAEIYDKKVG